MSCNMIHRGRVCLKHGVECAFSVKGPAKLFCHAEPTGGAWICHRRPSKVIFTHGPSLHTQKLLPAPYQSLRSEWCFLVPLTYASKGRRKYQTTAPVMPATKDKPCYDVFDSIAVTTRDKNALQQKTFIAEAKFAEYSLKPYS